MATLTKSIHPDEKVKLVYNSGNDNDNSYNANDPEEGRPYDAAPVAEIPVLDYILQVFGHVPKLAALAIMVSDRFFQIFGARLHGPDEQVGNTLAWLQFEGHPFPVTVQRALPSAIALPNRSLFTNLTRQGCWQTYLKKSC